VLDLTDLVENKIKAEEFFDENYRTDGMRRLLKETFRRFKGESQQGAFVLSQAMGGGKTHNMIALGLLAKENGASQKDHRGPLRHKRSWGGSRCCFYRRESDAPFGVWGAIAEQLGQKQAFKNYYSPLSAPGQTAWINLLQGKPTLILLDELAPYLEDARSKPIGDSNLARVTTTALFISVTARATEWVYRSRML
jgi:predicted AAA+ superfamily ATPase